MGRKRRCKVCGKGFDPHPLVGRRQKTCGEEACQRERNRQACRARYEQEGVLERAHRKRRRVVPDPDRPVEPGADPLLRVDWRAVEEMVGPGAAVVVEEVARILSRQFSQVAQAEDEEEGGERQS